MNTRGSYPHDDSYLKTAVQKRDPHILTREESVTMWDQLALQDQIK